MSGRPVDPIRATRPRGWRPRLWPLVQATLFRGSFHSWYGWRRRLLGAFGATLDDEVRVRRTVRIDAPWNLTMGRKSSLGDACVVWAQAPIAIGARSVCSQYTVLCTWSIDDAGCVENDAITIGDDVWIAAESFVAGGSRVGSGTLVGARSVARGELPEWKIAAGDPAKPRRDRAFVSQPAGA